MDCRVHKGRPTETAISTETIINETVTANAIKAKHWGKALRKKPNLET